MIRWETVPNLYHLWDENYLYEYPKGSNTTLPIMVGVRDLKWLLLVAAGLVLMFKINLQFVSCFNY